MNPTPKYHDLLASAEISSQTPTRTKTENASPPVESGYNSDLQLALLLIKLDAELTFESMKKTN